MPRKSCQSPLKIRDRLMMGLALKCLHYLSCTSACQSAALFFAGLHVFSMVPVSPLVVPSKASCYGALKSLPLSCHLEIQQYSYHGETKGELFFLEKRACLARRRVFQFEQEKSKISCPSPPSFPGTGHVLVCRQVKWLSVI